MTGSKIDKPIQCHQLIISFYEIDLFRVVALIIKVEDESHIFDCNPNQIVVKSQLTSTLTLDHLVRTLWDSSELDILMVLVFVTQDRREVDLPFSLLNATNLY